MKFIDLFAGIGGFHYALHNLGAECVFASEIDKYARETYQLNLAKVSPLLFDNNTFNDDIMKITDPKNQIPDFDILCAGFPCQPFSQAGHKRGFEELHQNRGNMFFKICEILEAKRPKAFFLENVRHILKHDDGKTFDTIKRILTEELGYTFDYKMVKASDHGLPQHRPRIFMVGFNKDYSSNLPEFAFPAPTPLTMTMSDIWQGECPKEVGYTLRVGGRGSGLHDRRNWDSYLVNGKEQRLTSKEGIKMMGLPETFKFPVSEAQAMKQLGNSVAVNAIQATAEELIKYLDENTSLLAPPLKKAA
ncbi:MAG: DNA cytosine methyltransferase [Alphaproteobacteria bacterium]|nr:DNA cytosine methyltransferase [Alphaproteobacteria bacterium]